MRREGLTPAVEFPISTLGILNSLPWKSSSDAQGSKKSTLLGLNTPKANCKLILFTFHPPIVQQIKLLNTKSHKTISFTER